MTETERNELNLARACYKAENDEEGALHYSAVLSENPDNPEAYYFCRYQDYLESIVKKEVKEILSAITAMQVALDKAVGYVAAAEECSKSEKLSIVQAIVRTYTPVVDYVIETRISTSRDTIEGGVLFLYYLGNYIKKHFNSNPDAMKLAIIPWKEGVKLQQKFYAYKYEGYKAEDYVKEIRKVDPSYTIPKKAGCVSIGNK